MNSNFSNITITSGGIFFSSGGNEKGSYGAETVKKVDKSGSVTLNGTTVEGKVDAGGSVTAINAKVGSKIDAGGSITINSTVCEGKVDAGGSITANDSTAHSLDAGGSINVVSSKVSKKADAGGSITANRCEVLGEVNSGGSANIDQCPSIQSVTSGGQVTLRRSTVLGDVSTGNTATIVDSKIGGKLTCCSKHLVIEGSQIDTIDLRCSSSMSGIFTGGTHIVGNNVVIGNASFVGINGGRMNINTGNNSDNVFIDGVPLSKLMAQQANTQESKKEGTKQVLELRNCVVKNIIFEGNNGEVVLIGESVISGEIKGGKVRE